MKYINWIKLLSVLLCAMMLFTACATASEGATEPETDAATEAEATEPEATEPEATEPEVIEPETPLLGTVAPEMKSFFTLSKVNAWRTLGSASRLDGKLVSASEDGELVVLRNAKIDHMNNLTETFTVYNTVLNKAVLTVSNTYPNGSYDSFNFVDPYYTDPELRFPENVMQVTIRESGSIAFIEVARAKVTPIDEEVFEENEGNSHAVEDTYDYYDAAGSYITSTLTKSGYVLDYIAAETVLNFGRVTATFDSETMCLVSKVGADNEIVRYDYDVVIGDYGYYESRYQESASFHNETFFEVYNTKTGELVLRYYLDSAKGAGRTHIMAGGDVLVQYVRIVDAEAGEAYDADVDGVKVKMETYFVDVPTGIAKKIDFNYYIEEFYNAEEFAEYADTKGISLTESAANIAIALDIKAQPIDENNAYDLIVLNNDASVMFKMERIIPEHEISAYDPIGITILPTGDYLVSIANVITGRAIVTADGVVRSYLKSGARVIGKYVMLDGIIYDYDMNEMFKLDQRVFYEYDGDEHFYGTKYDFVTTIGNKIIVSEGMTFEDEEGFETYSTRYYALVDNDGSLFVSSIFADDITIVEKTDDYIIIYDKDAGVSGKYIMFNAELEHVLTTANNMDVFLCEDTYLVNTWLYVNGEYTPIVYTVK